MLWAFIAFTYISCYFPIERVILESEPKNYLGLGQCPYPEILLHLLIYKGLKKVANLILL